jgi:hypothetical protein
MNNNLQTSQLYKQTPHSEQCAHAHTNRCRCTCEGQLHGYRHHTPTLREYHLVLEDSQAPTEFQCQKKNAAREFTRL